MARKALLTVLAIAAMAATAAPAAAQYGGYDNIRPLRNGSTQVRVSGGCLITYDARGYRVDDRGCSGDDKTRGDRMFADYQAQNGRGYGNNGYGNAYGNGYDDPRSNRGRGFGRMPDNMRMMRNGETEIRMSRNCVITYDRRGYRVDDRGCSGDQKTAADREYADYR